MAHKTREIERTRLPNGVRVITERMPHVRSVSVGVYIGTGSREEEIASKPASPISSSTWCSRAPRTAPRNRSRAVVDSIGGGLDAFTSKELVSYNVKVLDEHLPEAFEIVADLVRNPLFEKHDIEKEKGVILEELKMEADNPEYLIHEIFSSNFWKGHALGRSILGTKQTIRTLRSRRGGEVLRTILRAREHPDHGRGQPEAQTHAGAGRGSLCRSQAAETAAAPKEAPQPHAPLIFRNKNSLEQVHVYLGVPSIPVPHESRFICYILNAILGGGMSSRLFQNIREKQGLAYTVYSELAMYRDAGCMMVYAGTSLKWAGKVIDSIVHELHEVTEHLVSPEELRRAKDHLKGSSVLGLESTSSRMSNLARQELYFKKFLTIDEMLERIEQVTAEEVQSLAQQFFDPKRMAVAMLGRLEGFRVRRQDLTR